MADAKAPRPFNKPIPATRYRKKVRNRIYLETDRSFLDEITEEDAQGRIVLARVISKEERNRLKKLSKEARKNRGAVRTGKLVILGVLIAAVVLFNVLLKDRLVERGGERFLEALFGAQADLSGVVFRPLAGEVDFRSLTVADAGRPMTNLFELGEGRLILDSWQLLSGHVLISDLNVSGLAFATRRDTSGASNSTGGAAGGGENAEDTAVGAGTSGERAPVSMEALGLPDTLDARAFLEREYARLQSPVEVETLARSGAGYVTRWQGELQSLADSGTAAATEIRRLASTDINSIQSVDRAIEIVEQTNALVTHVTGYAERVEISANAAIEEATSLVARAGAIPAVIEADYRRVLERIPEIEAHGEDFLAGLVQSYLRGYLGEWYDRILVVYGHARRLEQLASDAGIARTAGRSARQGRQIDFTTRDYPSFEISQGFFSSTGDRTRELILEGLSSDADLSGRPTLITYRDAGERLALDIGAVVDLRSDAPAPLAVTVSAADQPLALRDGLAALGLERLDATSALELTLLRSSDGSASGRVEVETQNMALAGTPEAGSIGELVRDVLTGTDALIGSFAYQIGADASLTFSQATTNLDERIGDVVQARIDATLAAFEQRVESELDALLGPQLARVNQAVSRVIDLEATARELLELAADREAAARALETRAASAVDDLRSALEEEAQRRLEEARAEAERAAREAEAAARAEVERRREDAEAAARREAERAAAEAEEAVRDQADEIRNRLNLPGF